MLFFRRFQKSTAKWEKFRHLFRPLFSSLFIFVPTLRKYRLHANLFRNFSLSLREIAQELTQVFRPVVCFALPSSATVIIEPVNTINSSTSFLSVPLHYGHSPDSWTPVSGYLVLGNQTEQFLAAYRLRNPNGTNPPLILVDFYSPPSPPYFEPRLLRWARAYNPVAVAVFGGAGKTFWFCVSSWVPGSALGGILQRSNR